MHNHTPEMANHAREFHYNFDHTSPQVRLLLRVHLGLSRGHPANALAQCTDAPPDLASPPKPSGIWWEDLDSGDVGMTSVAKYAQAHAALVESTSNWPSRSRHQLHPLGSRESSLEPGIVRETGVSELDRRRIRVQACQRCRAPAVRTQSLPHSCQAAFSFAAQGFPGRRVKLRGSNR